MSKRRPKLPKGCFWRGGVIYGRTQIGGIDAKFSLHTDDPRLAKSRRDEERKRQVAAVRYGEARRSFAEALQAWAGWIVDQVSPKTVARYTSSLAVLQPHLEGMHLDEFEVRPDTDPVVPSGAELIGNIVAARRDNPTIPTGKKRPITVTIATIKRDLTALSSVFDYCIDEKWMRTNPVLAWLKPAGRRRSRLKERRDPIQLPEHAHIQMVIDRAPGLLANMIRAAVKTGARYDELKQAERAHLDRDRRQLTVIGKRNKMRVIDLVDGGEDFGWEALASLPVSLETKALFWHRREARGRSRRGQQPAARYREVNFDRLVAAVAEQAQKQDQDFRPFPFHDLRHRAAVDWLKSGRSIYVLQQRLGHSSVKTTEMYLQYLTADEIHRAKYGALSGSDSGSGPAVRTKSESS